MCLLEEGAEKDDFMDELDHFEKMLEEGEDFRSRWEGFFYALFNVFLYLMIILKEKNVQSLNPAGVFSI